MMRSTHSISVRLCRPRELAHQRRPADDAGEEAGDLEVLAVLLVDLAQVLLQQRRIVGDQCFVQHLRGDAAVSCA